MRDLDLTLQRRTFVSDVRRLPYVPGRQPPQALRAQHSRATTAPVHAAEPTTSLDARRAEQIAQRPSRRERNVLELLADGYTTREIAQRMAYSERTIKNILQAVTSRLKVRNRTQAVAYAVRNGWI